MYFTEWIVIAPISLSRNKISQIRDDERKLTSSTAIPNMNRYCLSFRGHFKLIDSAELNEWRDQIDNENFDELKVEVKTHG